MNQSADGVATERRREVSDSNAPLGFLFPEPYQRLISVEQLPDISPMFWLLRLRDGVTNWTRILAEQFPDRILVPFAKDRASDDVFCFEGSDTTGNPAVLLIHSFTDPGWEYRGEWLDFESWLADVLDLHDAVEAGHDDQLEPPHP